MFPAPPRFREDEYEILRVCERNHWTYAQWDAMSETEQIDHLAYQLRRDEYLSEMLSGLTQRIDDEQPVELTALVTVMMQLYAA